MKWPIFCTLWFVMIIGKNYASLLNHLNEEIKKKKVFSPRQYTRLLFCDCDSKVVWLILQNSSTSSLFTRLSNDEVIAEHLPILKTWINHNIRVGLKNLSIGLKGERLCWEIKAFSPKGVSSLFFHWLIKYPSYFSHISICPTVDSLDWTDLTMSWPNNSAFWMNTLQSDVSST